jgi:hypothetical protein
MNWALLRFVGDLIFRDVTDHNNDDILDARFRYGR